MKKINFYTVITLLLSVSCLQNAHAALVNGSILNFTAALGGHNATGTTQPLAGTGSWWAFPDSNLYLGIESFNGLVVGISQSASSMERNNAKYENQKYRSKYQWHKAKRLTENKCGCDDSYQSSK